MAIYYFHSDAVVRSHGRLATGAAAYQAGERIQDERTGKVTDYSHRQDVLHKDIVLPSQFDAGGADWARNRASLWNTAEHAEKRSNSRVAREYTVALPAELSPPQRLLLARAFSQELSDRYNVAVDLAVHEARSGHDPRNFHAHLLTTTREITPTGLGAKTGLDMSTPVRRERGFDGSREFFALRERWATLTNEALREAGVEARVDHRSRRAQALDRELRARMAPPAQEAERRGLFREIVANIREAYRARVEAHREQTTRRKDLEKQPVPTQQSAATEKGSVLNQRAATDTRGSAQQSAEVPSRSRAEQQALESFTDPRDLAQQSVEAWSGFRADQTAREVFMRAKDFDKNLDKKSLEAAREVFTRAKHLDKDLDKKSAEAWARFFRTDWEEWESINEREDSRGDESAKEQVASRDYDNDYGL